MFPPGHSGDKVGAAINSCLASASLWHLRYWGSGCHALWVKFRFPITSLLSTKKNDSHLHEAIIKIHCNLIAWLNPELNKQGEKAWVGSKITVIICPKYKPNKSDNGDCWPHWNIKTHRCFQAWHKKSPGPCIFCTHPSDSWTGRNCFHAAPSVLIALSL